MGGSRERIDGLALTPERLAEIARDPCVQIEVSDSVMAQVRASRELLESMVREGRVIYGVNTSMGGFVNWLVPTDQARQLQENLVNAVASNVGDYFPDSVVRAGMAARINSLCRGASGISPENLQKLIAIFNAGIVPCVPELGSLGASGDLGPLATIALACIGQWRSRVGGETMPSMHALKRAGIEPMVLSYKEGLALINGTSMMAGLGAILVEESIDLIRAYDVISAMSFEALHAMKKPFDPVVHAQKPHRGQTVTALNIFNLLADSQMITDEAELALSLSRNMADVPKSMDQQIEDAYSIRCTPQIMGAIRDSVLFARGVIDNELNSSNDNPLILTEHKDAFHNGHFHGQYVSMVMDHLSIAATTLCNLSERRIDRFLDRSSSNGLPAFLCRENPGLRLGLMGGQFMATSLTAENRSLCIPLSIQTLTSTAGFQDIVSMGLIAARRAQTLLRNTQYVVAFELICAAQAAEIRGAHRLSTPTRALYDLVRCEVPYLDRDEMATVHIEAAAGIMRSEGLKRFVRSLKPPIEI